MVSRWISVLFATAGLVSCDGGTSVTPSERGCDSPEPIVVDGGGASGLVRCADGSINRVDVADAALGDAAPPVCEVDLEGQCSSDADCDGGAFGLCVKAEAAWWGGDTSIDPADQCGCSYSCTTDAQCGEGACLPPEVGLPGTLRPVCVSANCSSDADCESGECGLADYDDGCGRTLALVCRAATDGCRVDGDCADAEHCTPSYGGGWTCQVASCVVGRPLRVGGVPRLAPSVGVGWSASAVTLEQDLEGGEAWSLIASGEHASVASFARFVLQLQGLGAPAELVAMAADAMADELRHAQGAYAIASALCGEEVGPGRLDVRGLEVALDPAVVARELVVDAAVNETLAAAEAAWGASVCGSVDVRAHLEAVAVDEARHAGLGWRALRWLLAREPSLVDDVRRCFEQRTAELLAQRSSELHRPELGLLGGPAREALVASTLTGVVAPLADALLRPAVLRALAA